MRREGWGGGEGILRPVLETNWQSWQPSSTAGFHFHQGGNEIWSEGEREELLILGPQIGSVHMRYEASLSFSSPLLLLSLLHPHPVITLFMYLFIYLSI